MPVTTSNTIKFSDVCQEIYGNPSTANRSLMGAHNAATGTFNQSFNTQGALRTLLDFRGYNHNPVTNPLTPTGLYQLDGGIGQLTAAWNTMANATSYNVYVDGTLNGSAGAASYTVFGLNEFQFYAIQVSSLSSGFESALSAVVNMTPSTF